MTKINGVQSANRLLDALEETCYKLEKFPERGHVPPELRSTGINNYLEILKIKTPYNNA